jgi:hypothetical protein
MKPDGDDRDGGPEDALEVSPRRRAAARSHLKRRTWTAGDYRGPEEALQENARRGAGSQRVAAARRLEKVSFSG